MAKRVLIVGAGFAGACYARECAEAGHYVDVIDRREHTGGNAYDEICNNGIRIHRYGPHLFHTSNEEVVKWVSRFTEFVPYEHKVQAKLQTGNFVPLPINRVTVNEVFGKTFKEASEVEAFLLEIAETDLEPRNAAEYLRSRIGATLTDLFFRPYTKKMWQLDLEELDASVVQRIPLRADDEDRYFPSDKFQILPRHGYSALFNEIFVHENIKVHLSTAFRSDMLLDYDICFNSMPIDEFFDYVYGPLPYRSIKFHNITQRFEITQGTASVINFTDDGIYTRITDWSRLPCHVAKLTGYKTVTLEEPCDYKDNSFERYYPVKTCDGRFDKVYLDYKTLADGSGKCAFIGRCGTYKYLDMHQVINQSRIGAKRWLQAES